MELSSGNQRCSLLTAKEKLRKAKNNFLRLRKTGDDAFVHLAKKHKRAVRRDIGSIDGEFIHELKGRKDHA
jgi:hypothetical protein